MNRRITGIALKLFLLMLTAVLISLFVPLKVPLFDDPYATLLLSRDGEMLGARIADDGQWRFPPGDSLSGKFRQALVLYEDRYFLIHPGINPVSMIRALRMNIEAGKVVSGGSTISMQLARILCGNKPRTFSQKLYELWVAFRLEVQLTKEEIIEAYAAHAPFGGNVVGIEAASWRYFGRSPAELSWSEAAGLAVLPNSPSLVYPGKNDHRLTDKRNRLLRELEKEGFMQPVDLALSLLEPVPGKPRDLPLIASHLLDRAIQDGFKGKRVISSLDKNLQVQVTDLAEQHSEIFRFVKVHNTSVLVTEIETGKTMAYVGNSHAGQEHAEMVDMVGASRSPGSLLKPLLYAMAIDGGHITPYELLPDVPAFYRGFSPQNFDKHFSGAVKAHHALRSSLNVPFVNLLKDYGYENFHHKLKKIGLTSLNHEAGHYGLSMILGGGEVTMWEMSALYGGMVRSLASDALTGKQKNPLSTTYLQCATNQVEFEPAAASGALWHSLEALQELRRPDNESNWQRFGSARPIAWKTGTSYGNKDAWAIGMNRKYLVAVWTGNADGEGRSDLVGVTASAPLMFQVFGLLDGDAEFPMPPGLDVRILCSESGLLASDICPRTEHVLMYSATEEPRACTYHQIVFLDENEKYRVNALCYSLEDAKPKPWFILPPTESLYYKKGHADYRELPPFITGCLDPEDGIMEMVYPYNTTKVYVPIEIDAGRGKVVFEAAHRETNAMIYWHLDDQYLGSTEKIHQMALDPPNGKHRLTLYDQQGRELTIHFTVLNDTG